MTAFEQHSLQVLVTLGVLVAAMVAAAVICKGKFDQKWFAFTFGAYALYEIGFLAAKLYRLPVFAESRWNWSGMVYSLILIAIVLIFIPKSLRSKVGLTWRQASGSAFTWLFVAFYAAVFIILALQSPPSSFQGDWDTLAFQLTMPSLNEELFFRGLLVVMMDQTFGVSRRILGVPMGWGALISSIMFGLAHGLSVRNGISVDFVGVLVPGVIGLLGCWIKEKTGSLLAPVLMHSHGNSIDMVI